MTKQKKKRNKIYAGTDASVSRPVITRISAENRSPLRQWWFEKKRIAKPVIIACVVTAITLGLVFELIRLFSGA